MSLIQHQTWNQYRSTKSQTWRGEAPSPANLNPKVSFNVGRINMHSATSSDEVIMGTDHQKDQVNQDTARESKNEDDVLIASPMSIINQGVDEIDYNTTDFDNKFLPGHLFNSDFKMNTQRCQLSQRSNLLGGGATSRSSAMNIGNLNGFQNTLQIKIRDKYLIQSQRLRSMGTPMPISEKQMKILANNIEQGNIRSQYISNLIKGNSCVKPRSASSGTTGYGQPVQKQDAQLNLNKQQSSINQIERGKYSIGNFKRPQTPSLWQKQFNLSVKPFNLSGIADNSRSHRFNSTFEQIDDQNNQSLNELDYMEDSKFELPVSPMHKNFDLMRQLRSSYPLDLNETNKYPEGETPGSSNLIDDYKLRASSLDYVGNIRQSANRLMSSTINQVNNVANQVSSVVVGDGVLNNVETVGKNIINKTKQAVGTVLVQPINRGVQFVDQTIVDPMSRGVQQFIMSPKVINEKTYSDDSKDSNGANGQFNLKRRTKFQKKTPKQKTIPGHTLIQQLFELKDPNNSNDQTKNNEKIDSILRYIDESKHGRLNISSSYNSNESSSESSCKSHTSGNSSNQVSGDNSDRSRDTKRMSNIMHIMQTNNFYDRQKKKTMAKMTKVFRQPTKKPPQHNECLILNNSNLDQSYLNQTQNNCEETKILNEQIDKYRQFKENHQSFQKVASLEINELINQVQLTPIFGKKFNYCLDPSIQNFKLFRCQITISDDEDQLVIYNLRPISKKIAEKCKSNSHSHKQNINNKNQKGESQCQSKNHHLGGIMRKPTIMELIHNHDTKKTLQRKKSKNFSSQGQFMQNQEGLVIKNSTPLGGGLIRKLTSNFSIKSTNGDQDHSDDEIEGVKQLEENHQTKRQLYQRVKSSASCSFDQIEAIVFGGLNSRFWVFRKHINSFKLQKQDSQELKENMPFYAWQCISIQLKKRTIDLVIESEKEMMNLIKILVFKLDILDGFKGSSLPLQKRVYQLEYKREYSNLRKTQPANRKIKVDSDKIWDIVKTQVYRKAVLKYKILVIRSKISYQAFQKKMTIPELFYDQITKTYSLIYETHIPYPPNLIQKFSLLVSGDLRSVFTRLIEFEIEHKKFMLKKNGQSEDILKAINETQKTLYAIKKRDRLIVKDKMSIQIRNIFGILEASGRIQPKKTEKQHMIDIFQDTQVGGYNMYNQMSKDDASHYRRERGNLEGQLRKINIILQMGNLQGTFYTRTLLKKIELVKQIFVLDIEQDQEVFIPSDLSQNKFPMNFQFYDPLINIIWQYISPDKEQYFSLKTQYNIDIAINQNWKLKLVNVLGSDKMTNRHDFLNDQIYLNLDHTKSQHSKSLQKSDYMQIEHRTCAIKNDLKFLLHEERQKHVQSGNMQNANKTGENLFKNMPLIIRYCNHNEVQNKRSKFLKFKQTYLVKHQNIKNQGQKLKTLGQVTSFIEENIDSFYENKEEIRQTLTKKGYKRSLTCGKKKCCSGIQVPQNQNKTNETRAQQRMTHRKQQQMKNKFLDELIDVAHTLLDKKRHQQRMKFYNNVRKTCSPNVLYQAKNQYLNNNIEATQEYFSNSQDLKNPNRVVNSIRKQVDEINNRILQNQQMKKITQSRSSSVKDQAYKTIE